MKELAYYVEEKYGHAKVRGYVSAYEHVSAAARRELRVRLRAREVCVPGGDPRHAHFRAGQGRRCIPRLRRAA
eukprot:9691494-Alexandrium_andersonii.AAC.1